MVPGRGKADAGHGSAPDNSGHSWYTTFACRSPNGPYTLMHGLPVFNPMGILSPEWAPAGRETQQVVGV
jgi:hypothetical protein